MLPKGRRVLFGSQLEEMQSIMVRGHGSRHMRQLVRLWLHQEAETDESWAQLAFSSLSSTPLHGMAPPTLKVGLPPQFNLAGDALIDTVKDQAGNEE